MAVIVAAKKAKLSFEELNLFTLNDFLDYVEMYIGEEETEADQTDIDRFYSSM